MMESAQSSFHQSSRINPRSPLFGQREVFAEFNQLRQRRAARLSHVEARRRGPGAQAFFQPQVREQAEAEARKIAENVTFEGYAAAIPA